jgi:hypothetical protein
MVIIRETREVKRTTCWSVSSPAMCTPIRITATLSDMSDCLLFLSSHSMSYYIWMSGLDDGYGYVYHDYYCIYFNYLDDACFMHVIAYRCQLNILT